VTLCAAAGIAQAQVFPEPPDPEGPTVLTRAQLPPPDIYMQEGLQNYSNFSLSFNGVYDSTLPLGTVVTGQGTSVQQYGGWGGQFGGGFNVYHRLQHGLLWMSYNGSYTRYQRSQYTNATFQSFSAAYSKMLSRRWTLRASEGLSFTSNLGSAFTVIPTSGLIPSFQPYTQKMLLNSTALTLGYQATHRLSYFFGGNLFSATYRPTSFASYFGLSGEAGVSYRFTRRMTLTGSYSISHLGYSTGDSTAGINTGSATLSYQLTRRIQAGVSAGVTRVNASGSVNLLFQGLPPDVFVQGIYKQTSLIPNFTGTISRSGRRSRFGITGGEGVSGGNGTYLTSKNLFVNGSANYQFSRRLSLNGLVGYSRLTSVANAAANYSGAIYNVDVGYEIKRHIFASASYSKWNYPSYGNISGFDAHRLTFGVTFASRDYPLPY
jgi:outer membrane scaffolding protein for murein synthesis (MipA/OmpV family)